MRAQLMAIAACAMHGKHTLSGVHSVCDSVNAQTLFTPFIRGFMPAPGVCIYSSPNGLSPNNLPPPGYYPDNTIG